MLFLDVVELFLKNDLAFLNQGNKQNEEKNYKRKSLINMLWNIVAFTPNTNRNIC